MNKLNPLVSITLSGFQVFDEPTYIPLARLTLIFGPNSAGKSAVQDAIDTIKAFEADKKLFSEPGGSSTNMWVKLLGRHRRKTFDNDNMQEKPMHIYLNQHICFPVDQALLVALNMTSVGKQKFPFPFEIENCWSYFDLDLDYELRVESKVVVRFEGMNGKLSVNLQHPIFDNINWETDFVGVQSKYSDLVNLTDGFFTFTKNRVLGFHPCGIGVVERGRRWLEFAINPSKEESCKEPRLIHEALAELSLVIGYLMKIVNGYSSFDWRNVKASRQIPRNSDLTYKFGWIDNELTESNVHGDVQYRELANSLAGELHNYSFMFSGRSGVSNHLATCVNRALSDHLFLENGYRVAYEYRVLLSEKNSIQVQKSNELDRNDFGYIVQLHLRDVHDRKHMFDDVGSGIGYVLPVLCAAYGDSGRLQLGIHQHPEFIANAVKDTANELAPHGLAACFIQQPELHLHPALQAALGDVLIESSNAGMQLLIETHSEHLILRVLKRIRRTFLQVNNGAEQRISPDDVSVLYFKPSPEGITKVTRLRISKDGEFMDRWPDGFFGERGRELFDE